MRSAARADLIRETLGREPRVTAWVDDGYDFEVAVVDREWAFRFPRRDGVVEALEVEIVLLPALAPALPVAVPCFEHVVREPELAVAYRLIDGAPIRDEDPAAVAASLSALHAFDSGSCRYGGRSGVGRAKASASASSARSCRCSTSTNAAARERSSGAWSRSTDSRPRFCMPTSGLGTCSAAAGACSE
jgi:hypothetical protein